DGDNLGRGLQGRPGPRSPHPRNRGEQALSLPLLNQVPSTRIQTDEQNAWPTMRANGGTQLLTPSPAEALTGCIFCGKTSVIETLRPTRADRMAASNIARVQRLFSPLVSAGVPSFRASRNWLRIVAIPARG